MSMVEQLMEAERARGSRFTRQKETYEKQQNAWKDLNTRLDNLYKKLDTLADPVTFESKTVNITGNENVSVSADTNAATGTYRVQVQQLATQSRLEGTRVEGIDSIRDSLGQAGSLTINGEEIEITSEDSLRSVLDKINAVSGDSGVRANIIDNRLVFQSTEYGAQDIEISGDANLTDRLGLDNTQFTEGQEAIFTIDGMEIVRNSNRVDDVIEGLTFTLTNVHEGNAADTITIADDIDKIADALNTLVEQYNSVQSYIRTQLDVGDPSQEDNQTGALVGDSAIMRLQTNLRNLFSRPQETDSESIQTLRDLGVEINAEGIAVFNRGKFEEQMTENPQDVQKFFSNTTRVRETSINEDGEEVTSVRDVKSGFAHNMQDLVNEYISGTSGIIRTRTDTYDRMIRDVNRRIEVFNERMEKRQARMIQQFTALDTAMMQAEAQMDQLFSQLNSFM
jgi:flagellar hook-associated protein 2